MKPDVLEYFEERFGLHKSLFKDFRLYTDRKGRALLGPKNLGPERIVISVGMQAATISGAIKPSTNFLQLFGKHATKNVIPLAKEQAHAYLKGDDILLSGRIDATDGYVLLRYLDCPLACGLLKNKAIKNLLAKPRRMDAKHL